MNNELKNISKFRLLTLANRHFRNGEIQEALAAYREFSLSSPHLANLVQANIRLCEKRVEPDTRPKENRALVSAIVPIEKWDVEVRRGLSSICDQTLPSFEILVICNRLGDCRKEVEDLLSSSSHKSIIIENLHSYLATEDLVRQGVRRASAELIYVYKYRTSLTTNFLEQECTKAFSVVARNRWKDEAPHQKQSHCPTNLELIRHSEFNLVKTSLTLQGANPLVSIVVPVYNGAPHISQCLDSLRAQTLDNIEVIVIDDGSKDETTELVKNHTQSDPRIMLITCSSPSGHPGTPRNIGMCAARGEYIGFIDADDWAEPEMYEALFKTAQKTQAEIISASGFFKECDGKTNRVKVNYVPIDIQREKVTESFRSGYFSNVWNRIYKRDFIHSKAVAFPNIYISEDLCFSIVTHLLTSSTAVCEGSFYHYRYNRPNSTTDLRQGIRGFSILHSLDSELKYFKSYGIQEDLLPFIFHKKLNSFWYTYERLETDLKPKFLEEMQFRFAPHLKNLNFDLFSKEELSKMSRLGFPLIDAASFQQDNADAKNEVKTLGQGPNNSVLLKTANQMMAKKNYVEAAKIYDSLAPVYDTAIINSALCSLIVKDLMRVRLKLVKLKRISLGEPIRKHIKDLSCRANNRINPIENSPLISVIVPIHNSGAYLEQCLNSLISQRYQHLQIILIDDGSNDSSPQIIKHFSTLDRRIHVITNKVASGNPGTPRNQGIDAACGTFIAFVDSDDWLSPDFIEKLVGVSESGADIIFSSGYTNCTDARQVRHTYANSYFNDATHPLFRYHESFTIWDKLYRRDFLNRFSIRLGETKAAVDIPFVLKAYYYCNYADFCIDNDGYFYRRESSSSVTLNKRRKSNCDFEFQAYAEIEKWLRNETVEEWYCDLVSLKKVSSYLYTLRIIASEFRDNFYKRAKMELKKTDQEKICELLNLLKQHKKRGQYEKISCSI